MLWLTPLWFPFTSHGRPSFNCSAIAGSALLDFIFIRPFQLCTRRFGPGLEPLRLLSKLRRASVRDDVAKSRMALFNSRSLANKTFILNDLFLTLQLDVLLLTKPWIHPGELPSLNSFPLTVFFPSSPRLPGKVGGQATVFKNKLKLQRPPTPTFSCVEAQLFDLTGPPVTLCAVIYQPPKYNKSFISGFADFPASLF